ncbi:Fic family protein [Candidatus Woesearchaeota archaeon]|nr:Fic family protein [Candidatus Woesearchaeota archaeon]
MVFIYKKSIGNKEYYYLRASLTKNGKQITKDIAYLGNNPSKIKEKLALLPQIHQKEIRKTYKTIHKFLEVNHYLEKIKKEKLKKDQYLDESLNVVEACKLHWNNVFQKLDINSKDELLNDFVVSFSYNTTSLEGNTITLKEAENLLINQKTPKDRTLREVYDLQNTRVVFFKYYEKIPNVLTHDVIQDVHSLLIDKIDVRKGYRTQDIRVTKTRFKSSPAQYVKTDMTLLLKWLREHKNKLHPLVLATIFHHKFEKIHPFFDGNGRTGRLLANIILLQNNYPPLIIRKKNRKKYLDALSKADILDLNSSSIDGYSALVKFSANEFVENYWNTFL